MVWKLLTFPFSDKQQAIEKIDKILVAASWISKDWASVAYTASQAIKTQGESLTEWNVRNALAMISLSELDFVRSQYDHPEFLDAVQQWARYDDDVISLLWFESPQTYIIALQNTAEKRPNWGFFWSFALLTLYQWQIKQFEVIDSYLPWYDKPGTSITGPAWLQEFLPDRIVYFIGANKTGFTYHDWGNIKTLYEKSYPGKKIRGVVFVNTDLFEQLIPWFEEQLRERQFTNASVDLIRGNDTRGKKESYLKWSQEYFKEHASTMFINLFKNIEAIRKENFVNLYLTDISWPLHGYLRRAELTTRFESDTVYLRDSNISFNKVDRFVSKTTNCSDQNGQIIVSSYNDRLSLEWVKTWTYSCIVRYALEIPENYREFIGALEEKYEITLWEREQHILALDPERHTRAIAYYPKNITIESISGDSYDDYTFETPFSNALTYKVWLGGEQMSKEVRFDMVME